MMDACVLGYLLSVIFLCFTKFDVACVSVDLALYVSFYLYVYSFMYMHGITHPYLSRS